jgi:hypothetical protein
MEMLGFYLSKGPSVIERVAVIAASSAPDPKCAKEEMKAQLAVWDERWAKAQKD